ncbi:HAD-IIB family hydrolase [uncultured Endozoicomonas sp.]|uniref:HAD-IIB family hydrolase n=1 Tax=uncultured Endozoicomonas sp. TaxID=432652 RepID=UPI00262B52FF|nr:HAD-IIB family hydrolase [uncultured Endozoicomonas sp.]
MKSNGEKWLVFTDLDGTLLDHDSYGWEGAEAALKLLAGHDIPVIINTSKTLPEVVALQRELDLKHPFITENGMVTTVPGDYFPNQQDTETTHFFHGLPYRHIRRWLINIRQQNGFRFQGFGDLTVNNVVELTGLSEVAATQAMNRKASEPLIWMDTEKALTQFKQLLNDEGLYLTRGGRFYHVSGKGNKGQALLSLLQRFQSAYPDTYWKTIGLGDGMNDQPMLEAVDYPVLIRSEHGAAPDIRHLSKGIETTNTGSKGWNEAIQTLIQKHIY